MTIEKIAKFLQASKEVVLKTQEITLPKDFKPSAKPRGTSNNFNDVATIAAQMAAFHKQPFIFYAMFGSRYKIEPESSFKKNSMTIGQPYYRLTVKDDKAILEHLIQK